MVSSPVLAFATSMAARNVQFPVPSSHTAPTPVLSPSPVLVTTKRKPSGGGGGIITPVMPLAFDCVGVGLDARVRRQSRGAQRNAPIKNAFLTSLGNAYFCQTRSTLSTKFRTDPC